MTLRIDPRHTTRTFEPGVPHVVFTGGGTGGHLFPGLAVAAELRSQLPAVRVTFAGGGKPLEREHTAAAGFEYLALPCRPMPRRVKDVLPFVVDNAAGWLAAGRFLKREHVAAVVGLGGYASVPMARAAAWHGVPLVLLEQNVVPGKANRWLARSAELICTSFAETRVPAGARCTVRFTGNPIRSYPGAAGILEARRASEECGRTRGASHNPRLRVGLPCDRTDGTSLSPKPLLLVLGGSSGAHALNQHVPRALARIRGLLAGWRILHQSGAAEVEATRAAYREVALDATVEAFVADLPAVMAAGGLAVCRAGGTSLAELAAAGVPAVLLPYPHAADDHQRRNAEVFAAAGGACVVDERECSGRLDERVAEAMTVVLGEPGRRAAMSAAMHGLARPHAAGEVAALIRRRVSKSPRTACGGLRTGDVSMSVAVIGSDVDAGPYPGKN